MLNKRDSKIPPVGLNKRGIGQNKEAKLLQTVNSTEGQGVQAVQEATSSENLEVELPSKGVER